MDTPVLIINIILMLGAAVGMEFVAWIVHKRVMHGLLWSWHEDHHQNSEKK